MKLVDPIKIDESEFNDFIEEFKSVGEDLVPYSLNQKELGFEAYVASLGDESLGKGIRADWVPASTYFLLDDEGKIYGAVNIRHSLTEKLRIEGGHVGYGIKPSARNQGHGTEILRLAMDKVRELGIKRVLITCDKKNPHSARIITKNGGKLDSEIEKDNKTVQRYWIHL